MEPKRSNHFLAHLPTILLLVLFAMSPWLGILFFILRAIDRDAEKKEQASADPARDSHAEDARTAQSAASGQRSETVSDQDVPTAEQKSAKQWHKTLTTLCTIFGAIFLLVGIDELADAMELWGHEIDWGELLTALAQTIGGGAALFTGLRMDRARKLEAMMICADKDNLILVSGTGEVIEPDSGVLAIGSGGNYALAAARALMENTDLEAKDIAYRALKIASDICVFTNDNIVVETV